MVVGLPQSLFKLRLQTASRCCKGNPRPCRSLAAYKQTIFHKKIIAASPTSIIFTLAMELILQHPEFVTATIHNWLPLLQPEKHKKIIEDSLIFLVKDEGIILYAYCLMNNHIHLIWQVKGNRKSSDIRRDFFKYTAQQSPPLSEFSGSQINNFS
jgi:hypothetical protein